MSLKPDEYHDPEQHFVLRLPPNESAELRSLLKNGSYSRDCLQILLEHNMRYGKIKFKGKQLPALLVDLPCIVESMKTTDKKTFYKTADICQMLIADPACTDDPHSNSDSHGAAKIKVNRKFQWNHGLTPPMKNVRKRRFRKILKKKYIESPDVENEVKRLLLSDLEAVRMPDFELVGENDKDDSNKKELLGVFGDISSDSSSGHESDDNKPVDSATQLYTNIMKELEVIQQERDAKKQELSKVTGAGRIKLEEELSAMVVREENMLKNLEELRSKSQTRKTNEILPMSIRRKVEE